MYNRVTMRQTAPPPTLPAREAPERPFGATDLLHLVLDGVRSVLGFDVAVAVLCEDERHVVPIYAAGVISPAVVEGVHVQALQAFVELAGAAHAAWPSDDPAVISLSGASGQRIVEPEAYEDAPLVVEGAVTGMLRIQRRANVSRFDTILEARSASA